MFFLLQRGLFEVPCLFLGVYLLETSVHTRDRARPKGLKYSPQNPWPSGAAIVTDAPGVTGRVERRSAVTVLSTAPVGHTSTWAQQLGFKWLESLRSRTRPRLGNFEGTKAPKHLPMWSRASHARTASAATGNLGLNPVHEPPRPAACQVTWRCWISASLFGAQYDMSW